MKEPIQNTSAQFVGKDLKDAPEPFKTALAIDNYLVNWIEQKKIHTFYCSDYGKVEGEWFFTDVMQDTSDTTKPFKRGQVTLIREEYNPMASLVNIPFMVQVLNYLPDEGKKEGEVKNASDFHMDTTGVIVSGDVKTGMEVENTAGG